MRLPRTSLLRRLSGPDGPSVVLLEAPPGYGKSWLARRAAGSDVVRLRGELGPLANGTMPDAGTIIIDDAHLLSDEDAELIAELIEDRTDARRLVIAGRILPDGVHEAVHLVDGLVIDAGALAIDAEEIVGELPNPSMTSARRIVDAADGCVKAIATAIDEVQRDGRQDPTGVASHMVRVASAATLEHLEPRELAVIALLARAPGIDRHFLDRLAGDGFVQRAVARGVPLRRQVTGALDLVWASAFKSVAVDVETAAVLAAELLERGRPLDAVGLLLDAGRVDRAVEMVRDLSESITDTVEPRQMLSLLARLGPAVNRDPALLLLRASEMDALGRSFEAGADVELAVRVAVDAQPALRRRVAIASARAMYAAGRCDDAARLATATLADLGDGEARTYARAHEVLAACAASSDAREDLQRAAELFRTAASAWDSCHEFARARSCRSDMVAAALVPLARFDEALALLGELLSTPDLSDSERSWTMLIEGFVLFNANRLDSAESRFSRVGDLGAVHDNPRLVAAAAWGRAGVSSRRGERDSTMKWLVTAENTALSESDDVLGVPFLCDAATALGALGELDMATAYLDRAKSRNPVFPGQVRATEFLLDARKGVLGDLDDGLAHTLPVNWWQIKLVAALAAARGGDIERARQLADDAARELITLGFADFAAMGEGRTYAELQAALGVVDTEVAIATIPATNVAALGSGVANGARRLIVMGDAISVREGGTTTIVPPGIPQRVVGVLVASGGSATIDQVSDAIWPGEDLETSRSRLRNVLLRLRHKVGDVVVRTGTGLRIVPGLPCDLHDFQRRAADALAAIRNDPELAGELAADAVAIGDAPVFIDFEYDEWAVAARRDAEQRLIALLDFMSVQAEDSGDLAAAEALARRALHRDRYTDSRYVRLAELLTLQNRVAAAMAVLDDAAEVARDMGLVPQSTTRPPSDARARRKVRSV